VRNAGHVDDGGDAESGGGKCADGGFTPGARAFDVNLDLAVSWAAKGVDFFEPLKPALPALPQPMTRPSRVVTLTMVLLKEERMQMYPSGLPSSNFMDLRRR
jgi:hypothetical protein